MLLDALTPFFEQGTFGPPQSTAFFLSPMESRLMRRWIEDRFAGGSSSRPKTRLFLLPWRRGTVDERLRSIRDDRCRGPDNIGVVSCTLAQTPQPMPPGPPENPLRPRWGRLIRRTKISPSSGIPPTGQISGIPSSTFRSTRPEITISLLVSRTVRNMNGSRMSCGAKVGRPSAAIGYNASFQQRV